MTDSGNKYFSWRISLILTLCVFVLMVVIAMSRVHSRQDRVDDVASVSEEQSEPEESFQDAYAEYRTVAAQESVFSWRADGDAAEENAKKDSVVEPDGIYGSTAFREASGHDQFKQVGMLKNETLENMERPESERSSLVLSEKEVTRLEESGDMIY